MLVIGQEQDKRGGGFSVIESFVGSITQLNIWRRALVMSEVQDMAHSCEEILGDVVAWPDVLAGIHGDIKTSENTFCKGTHS